jgi:hypothetical protein
MSINYVLLRLITYIRHKLPSISQILRYICHTADIGKKDKKAIDTRRQSCTQLSGIAQIPAFSLSVGTWQGCNLSSQIPLKNSLFSPKEQTRIVLAASRAVRMFPRTKGLSSLKLGHH